MRAELLADEGSRDELPPTVYVPGIDGSGEMLFDAAPRLARRRRLLRLRYTCGGEDSYAHLAATVAACLAKHDAVPAHLLAESFGVAVALRVALDHPGVVHSLTLANGFAHYSPRVRLWLTRLAAPLVTPGLFRLGRRLVGVRGLLGRHPDPEIARALLSRDANGLDRGYRARLAMIADLDLRDELPRITRPALVLVSERDRVVPPRAGLELARALPQATLQVVEDAGHVVLPMLPVETLLPPGLRPPHAGA